MFQKTDADKPLDEPECDNDKGTSPTKNDDAWTTLSHEDESVTWLCDEGKVALRKTIHGVRTTGPTSAGSRILDTQEGSSDGFNVLEPAPRTKRKYWKNIILLAFILFFHDLSFVSIRDISSSLHHEANLGVVSLACIFAFLIAGNFVLVPFLHRLGPRKCFALAAVGTMVFAATNMYPKAYTLVPASCVVGLARALLLGPQAVYTTSTGLEYAAVFGEPAEVILSRFASITLLFQRMAPTIGAGVGSAVLTQMKPDDTRQTNNSGIHYTHGDLLTNTSDGLFSRPVLTTHPNQSTVACGAEYCHAHGISQSKGYVPPVTCYVLMGAYCFAAFLALILLKFLQDRKDKNESNQTKGTCKQLYALFHALRERKLQLLVPYMIYSGVQLSFFYGDVVKGFVTCAIGIQNVGFAMMTFSGISSVGVFTGGSLKMCLSPHVLYGAVMTIQGSLLILMLLWIPTSSDLGLSMMLCALWGLADGFLMEQQQSFLGHQFKDSQGPAFAALYLFRSLGQVINFAAASVLCLREKIYFVATIAVVSVIGYIGVKLVGGDSTHGNRQRTGSTTEGKTSERT